MDSFFMLKIVNKGRDKLWDYSIPTVIKHYGVKGMKWGVRRTPEQLGHKKKVANNSKNDILKTTSPNHKESSLTKQKSSSLRKGIRSLEKRIQEHETKISNPKKYCHDWNTYNDGKKAGLIRHWKKEIYDFKVSINDRIKELKKRGEYDDE